MKRTTQAERKQNARNFYQVFSNWETNRACIVVERNDNGRVQFHAVIGAFQDSNPVVIAESVGQGITGCWTEFITNVYGSIKQYMNYYDDEFKKWITENLGFSITYYDGFVFIIERSPNSHENEQ